MSKLLIFGIILYIVLSLLDYGYSALIRTSNWRPAAAWKDVVEGNIRADVIVSGSSRAWLQVDPHILDSILCVNSYNLGIDGSPIDRQVHKYEIFRKRNAKPKLIIQNIDVWSLEYTHGYENEQFYPFFWDKDMRNTFFRSESFTFGEKYIPLFRYHGMSPFKFHHKKSRTLYKGYRAQDRKWDGEAFRQQKSIDFCLSDTTLCIFDSFLQQTKEDSIRVIFVYAPLYAGATKLIRDIDQMHKTYKDLADAYDIPILDYTDMWLCSDTTYFYNAMHLNRAGAEIYTDSLANAIKRLGVL